MIVICNRCGNRYKFPRIGGCPNCGGVEVSLTGKEAAKCRDASMLARRREEQCTKRKRKGVSK